MRTRIASALFAASVFLTCTLPALAQPATPGAPGPMGPGGPMMGPGMGPYGPWMGRHDGFGWFFAINGVLRGLLILGLVLVVWRFLLWKPFWGRFDSAHQILRERFARGEINDEEYRKRLAAL